MIFLDFLKVKKFMKICSKKHQITPAKKNLGGEACPRTPLAKPRVASPPPKKN